MEATKIKNIIEFLKEEAGKFLKVFLFLYIGVLLVLAVVTMGQGTSNQTEAKTIFENIEESTEKVLIDKQNSIVIPGIGIEAPITLVDSTQPKDFIEPLKNGVVHYPSSLPGENGEIIILGHSSPPFWPKINYDWVFSKLNTLNTGDEVYIYFNNSQYKYVVEGQVILQAGQELPSFATKNSKSKLLLVSCWPPGIDNKRIVIYSELVD
ncbi:sortase [Patescibacteria group bacterium]|nr:sortase [Patescibacteria group bacterium]